MKYFEVQTKPADKYTEKEAAAPPASRCFPLSSIPLVLRLVLLTWSQSWCCGCDCCGSCIFISRLFVLDPPGTSFAILEVQKLVGSQSWDLIIFAAQLWNLCHTGGFPRGIHGNSWESMGNPKSTCFDMNFDVQTEGLGIDLPESSDLADVHKQQVPMVPCRMRNDQFWHSD